MGEVQELDVEVDLAASTPKDHMLHVVVQHLGRDSTQITKGPEMPIQETLQGAAFDELGVQGPAIA
jgi:hypothetical protein